MILTPKNWDKFQQYKDRKPTWIKLHRDLLNDFSYSSVQIGTKATLPLLWLLACEYDNGIIDASLEEISFRIHIDKDIVKVAIDELEECSFFEVVQDDTEAYKKVLREEKRRDREETEKDHDTEVYPSWLNIKSWNEWEQHRKEIKKKLTPSTIEKQLKFLEKHQHQHIEIINASIQNGWAGLFTLKKNKGVSNLTANISTANEWLNQENELENTLEIRS